MQKQPPISNESLARGLVHRTTRETVGRQTYATDRACGVARPTRQRRGPLFRAWVKAVDTKWKDQLLYREVKGRGKQAQAIWLYWNVYENSQFYIGIVTLDGREMWIHDQDLMLVSRHALQRLYQRLRTTDPSEALLELMPAVSRASQLQGEAQKGGNQAPLKVSTDKGVAVLTWDNKMDRFVVKTWICAA